ncbi:hypothetical protein ACI78V_22355 [Geodermatophilus sp. SYSU D00742]
MADDEQPPEGLQLQQHDEHQDGQPDGHQDGQLVEQLVRQFTEAIRDLVDEGRRPPPAPTGGDAGQALRQRVDFGYRALGALMGRVSRTPAAEFDVQTFAACWDDEGSVIHLIGPLDGVKFVELRAPRTPHCAAVTETVKVVGYGRGGARLEPKQIGPDRAIESMTGLGGRTGPLVAFGPRLAARTTDHVPAE